MYGCAGDDDLTIKEFCVYLCTCVCVYACRCFKGDNVLLHMYPPPLPCIRMYPHPHCVYARRCFKGDNVTMAEILGNVSAVLGEGGPSAPWAKEVRIFLV